MQMQLLLETPESPFQLLSSVFGESKFFSNFVLLQQMYLQRKRYVYKVFHELASGSHCERMYSILSFCFPKPLLQ